MDNTPLPTLKTQIIENILAEDNRAIYRYAYLMANGKWHTRERVYKSHCLAMCEHCARHGIPFRVSPMSDDNPSGTKFALLLQFFYNRLTDRCGHDTEKE